MASTHTHTLKIRKAFLLTILRLISKHFMLGIQIRWKISDRIKRSAFATLLHCFRSRGPIGLLWWHDYYFYKYWLVRYLRYGTVRYCRYKGSGWHELTHMGTSKHILYEILLINPAWISSTDIHSAVKRKNTFLFFLRLS